MIPKRIIYAQIDDENWKKFKLMLIKKEMSIKEFVEKAIFDEIEKEPEKEGEQNENIPER